MPYKKRTHRLVSGGQCDWGKKVSVRAGWYGYSLSNLRVVFDNVSMNPRPDLGEQGWLYLIKDLLLYTIGGRCPQMSWTTKDLIKSGIKPIVKNSDDGFDVIITIPEFPVCVVASRFEIWWGIEFCSQPDSEHPWMAHAVEYLVDYEGSNKDDDYSKHKFFDCFFDSNHEYLSTNNQTTNGKS